MTKLNHIIIIPGLGNRVAPHIWASKGWKKYGIIPHVFDAKWKIEEYGFDEKFIRALRLIDSLDKKDYKISIIGNSAGSSFAINLFGARKKIIHRTIINCGRVRDGDWPWFTFNQATALSPSFKESVLMAQEVERTFTGEDRNKILTLRPLFDEVVPHFTVPIEGAVNKTVWTIGHSLTIALNMTILQKEVLDFILTP